MKQTQFTSTEGNVIAVVLTTNQFMIMMTNCKFLSVTIVKGKKGCFETPAVPR